MKVHAQTVLAPVVTALLYYLVFAVALGDHLKSMAGVPYLQFLAPGLMMMTMAQNAFANTSSSLIIGKVQGNIVDVLMPPLSAAELVAGYTIGGIARGFMVGLASWATLYVLTDLPLHSFAAVVFYSIAGCMMLSLIGIIGGVWGEKFDHLATVQNFIILPATFLSGTFFTVDQLPDNFKFLCHLNPFFYMIDGFRYAFVGVSDGTLLTGCVMLIIVNALLLGWAYYLFATGYKLKA